LPPLVCLKSLLSTDRYREIFRLAFGMGSPSVVPDMEKCGSFDFAPLRLG
jgi:hypothetical protein